MDEKREQLPKNTTEIVNVELSNKALNDFLHLYKKMGANLSHTNFDKFLEILHNEEMTFAKEETVELFRTTLVEELTEAFTKMWNLQHIPQSISVLELLKERFENKTIPQWRPHGKSPSAQTLPNRIRLLEKKQNFLIKQWGFQKPKLETAVAQITTNRERIEILKGKREFLSYRMDEQTTNLEIVKNKIMNAQLKAIKLL